MVLSIELTGKRRMQPIFSKSRAKLADRATACGPLLENAPAWLATHGFRCATPAGAGGSSPSALSGAACSAAASF